MDERKPILRLPVLGADGEGGGLSRRRFLAMLGASAALATGAGCRRNRAAIVAYSKKQEEIVPGVANYYASTFQEGEVAYPVLVKAREGRPIHVEGNGEHPLYRGKTSFHATADLLGLYDPDRLRGPLVDGRMVTWKAATEQLARALEDAAKQGKGIALVTPAVLSPTRKALIARLAEALPSLRHVPWEPAADHQDRQAQRDLFGEIRLPRYRFDKAQTIVALEADFLGTLGDTVSAIAGFSSLRRPVSSADGMNRLFAIEGGMSLTGSKADVRIPMRPSALARIAFALVRAVHLEGGRALPEGLAPSALEPFAFDQSPEVKPFAAEFRSLVKDLCAVGDRALVLAGPAASVEAHIACHILNRMLRAKGSAIDHAPTAPSLSTPDEFKTLVDQMAAGQFAVAVFWDVNPAYDIPDGDADNSAWRAAMAKVPLRVRMGLCHDETATACNLVLPTNHWLESWNDFETSGDALSLQQPVVAPLYDTLQGEEVFLRCLAEMGRPLARSYIDLVKRRWQDEVAPKDSPIPFARFWNTCLHDGTYRRRPAPLAARRLDGEACTRAATRAAQAPSFTGFELVLDTDPRLFDGRYANNGWLQELPDPIARTSWGNPLSLSPADADRWHLKNGDMVSLGLGPALPILRRPGQAQGVLRLTLGHGRWQGSVAAGVGTRAWALAPAPGTCIAPVAAVTPTGGHQDSPLAQDHDTQDGRDIARLWSLAEYAKKPRLEREELPSLYDKLEQKGPRWGMAIDLSSCVGCGACVVACQSENNIPVVGPEQVRKGRAMHWIRVDRYYLGDALSPRVIHQPLPCQQCDNAPCESVCPVQATNHGPDGINQMAYNRCVGTRYCANNCPYKVRRFNFLDFTSETPASMQLAFNPEVTVRPRGVMEKCTFCVQRIRNAEQVAEREHRDLRDRDVVPACASACPASAIVFGDVNNPESEVARLSRSNRGFHVLEELGTKPAITYLAALRNPSGEGGS
ncbi:MAG: 4Fe-4S dicluster domain-containing protein [Polyangia bacterium]|jgi:molybdopterin-containing oxidoreductase family iron-sulfur binding subunit